MKKLSITIVELAIFSTLINAQVKVIPNGNVGIGTLTPYSKLELNSGNNNGIFLRMEADRPAMFMDLMQDSAKYNYGLIINMNQYLSKAITVMQNKEERVWISPRGIDIIKWNESYNFWVQGCSGGFTNWNGSDSSYKTNIKKIESPIETINNINGVQFDWNTKEFPNINFGKESSFGVIAQELERVLPDLVLTDKEGFKSVNYIALIPILIEAIKQQEVQIQILTQQINDCCNSQQGK